MLSFPPRHLSIGAAILFSVATSASFGADRSDNDLSGETQTSVIMEQGSNWSAEHCFEAEHANIRIDFDFSSPVPVNFNLHGHLPDRGTVTLADASGVEHYQGDSLIPEAGGYCFEFLPASQLQSDRQVDLQYRLTRKGEGD